MADNRQLADRIERALATVRQPVRVVSMTAYRQIGTVYDQADYLHVTLTRGIDLSDARQRATVEQVVGWSPDWTPGGDWIGFRRGGALWPANPIADAVKVWEWTR